MMFFNQRPIAESYSDAIDVPHDGLALAIHESMCEYEIEIAGKLPVALSNVYEMYICDTTHTTEEKVALFEGVLGDAWAKIKAFFKKIAAKIKSWWNNVMKYLRTFFSSNKKFLEKFKDELKSKTDIDKFTFTGYTYKNRKDIDTVQKEVESTMQTAKTEFDRASTGKLDYNAYKDENKKAKKKIDSNWMKLAKGEKPDAGDELSGSTSKFQDAFKKHVRGSADKQNLKIGEKGGLTVDDMIAYMEDESETMSTIKNTASEVSSAADDYADWIDTAVSNANKNVDDTKTKSENDAVIRGASEVAKYALSYGTAGCTVLKDLYTEIISQSSSVLRSLARYTPSKENYNISYNNGTSLLEAFSAGF